MTWCLVCMPQGWGDVYFFCGTAMQYCTCNFRWSLLGWYKAGVLWSFVLSAALGVQRLAMQAGLNGLLPGMPSIVVFLACFAMTLSR